MIEKNSQEAKIRKGLSAKRSPVCYQTLQDIVIPAGTVLRSVGADTYEADIGTDGGISTKLAIEAPVYVISTPLFKRVVA